MKNILIPSTLESDTLGAIQFAMQQSKGQQCTIFLTFLNEIPDTDSPAAFLRTMKCELTFSQKEVLSNCWKLMHDSQNCCLKIHNQYGISAPTLKNLIKHLSIDLTILPLSYKSAEKRIHIQFTRILENCKCPILHLNSKSENQDCNTAMYLEQSKSKLQIEDLSGLIPDNFNFKIVSQAKIFNDQNPEDLSSILNDAITKNNINILIETRKPKKIQLKHKTTNAVQDYGLPVLSLYEELV